MTDLAAFAATVDEVLAGSAQRVDSLPDELAYECEPANLLAVATALRDHPALRFEMMVDLAGVDYLDYGRTEWKTFSATGSGFSRGVTRQGGRPLGAVESEERPSGRRFAVVAQLLSISGNRRLRLRSFCADDEEPIIDSLVGVWASANWFERE